MDFPHRFAILVSMKEIFERIRELALPYQDKREDAGHHAVTLEYAQRLVKMEKGDEDVVIPAIILHDIGWSRIPKARVWILFDKKSSREEIYKLRTEHQDEGVKMARGILEGVGYPPELTAEILEIISQHDTRDGFISKNEGLVRDADKLWRFSKTGFEADTRRAQVSRGFECARLEKELENPKYLSSKAAREIARQELKLRKIDK